MNFHEVTFSRLTAKESVSAIDYTPYNQISKSPSYIFNRDVEFEWRGDPKAATPDEEGSIRTGL